MEHGETGMVLGTGKERPLSIAYPDGYPEARFESVSLHHTAARVRSDLIMLRAWIEHWQLDSQMGMASTKGSLQNAHFIAVRAIKELDELESK